MLAKSVWLERYQITGVAAVIVACCARAEVELELALTHAGKRNRRLVRRQDRSLTGVVAPFIAVEKKYFVLNHRTADRPTKSVANQGRASDAGVVVKPVIGGEDRITIRFEGCTMPASWNPIW